MSAPQPKPDKPLTPRQAWQPLTPRGVAAFAFATLTRLVIVQIIVAALVAAAVIWFLRVAWFPVLDEATRALPEVAVIRRAELEYPGETPRRLAENPRLAVVVDLQGTRRSATASDLEIVFEKQAVAFCGALGCRAEPYPPGYIITLDRAVLEPGWGAWQWPVLLVLSLAVAVFLLLSWWTLALFYLPFVKVLIFFADRQATWRGAWRLCAAGLIPGALLVAVALVLYGFGAVDLFGFVLLYVLHIVAGLVFVFTSPFFLPKIFREPKPKNPFAGSSDGPPANPFSV